MKCVVRSRNASSCLTFGEPFFGEPLTLDGLGGSDDKSAELTETESCSGISFATSNSPPRSLNISATLMSIPPTLVASFNGTLWR